MARTPAGELSDEIAFDYVTTPWGKPAKLSLAEVDRDGEGVLLEARVTAVSYTHLTLPTIYSV